MAGKKTKVEEPPAPAEEPTQVSAPVPGAHVRAKLRQERRDARLKEKGY